jgi:hypothetical protein
VAPNINLRCLTETEVRLFNRPAKTFAGHICFCESGIPLQGISRHLDRECTGHFAPLFATQSIGGEKEAALWTQGKPLDQSRETRICTNICDEKSIFIATAQETDIRSSTNREHDLV